MKRAAKLDEQRLSGNPQRISKAESKGPGIPKDSKPEIGPSLNSTEAVWVPEWRTLEMQIAHEVKWSAACGCGHCQLIKNLLESLEWALKHVSKNGTAMYVANLHNANAAVRTAKDNEEGE